jgi:hypothetical protein
LVKGYGQLVGSSEVPDCDSFSRKLGRMIDPLLRHQTKGKFVERGAADARAKWV